MEKEPVNEREEARKSLQRALEAIVDELCPWLVGEPKERERFLGELWGVIDEKPRKAWDEYINV